MEEEEFYGGGKGERDPRRKEKEKGDQEGIWDRQEGKERKALDQRGHWKKKGRGSLRGKRRRLLFSEDQSSRLLGLVFCLMMIVVFH